MFYNHLLKIVRGPILLVLIGMVTYVSVVQASEGGVKDWNSEAGVSYIDRDTSRRYNVDGTINIPISDYWGASIYALYEHATGKGNVVDADFYQVEGTVFLRDFDLGSIGASYVYTRSKFDLPASSAFSDSVNTDTYTIFGDYYISDFTFGLSRSKNKPDAIFQDSNTSSVTILWYVTDNTRVGLAAGGMDADDSYAYQIMFQPSYFDNAISFSLSYTDNKVNDVTFLSFNYYFDAKVSLKERDRKYH